jgi:receptor protein-tyrosine kinase
MAVASALALLLNALLPVVQSARALERTTGIPVLARLPVPTLARPTKLMRHLRQNPSSPLADSFRTLRISIALGSKDRAPRVMLLTSADKGEGKSVTGYLLAQSLVQAGRRVLLIDADPSKQGLFGRQPAGPGLNSVLLGEVDAKEVIRRDETSGIDILIAPEALREDADILAYNEGTEGLDGIKSGYDVVVVLAPPVQQLPDAQVLASLANAVLVVVRRHRSRPDAVAATLRQLANAGAPRLAMVLLDRSA